MKGVIFNLLEEFVCEGWGDEAYEEILALCPLHTQEPFVGPGTYPDADLMMIVARASEKVGVSVPEAVRAFGKFLLPKLATKFPLFVKEHTHPKTFLMTINDVIHVEVKKLFKDAEPPTLTFLDTGTNQLVLRYSSKRKLCALVEGMIDGTAVHFKQPISHQQTQCTLHGHPFCEFELTFSST